MTASPDSSIDKVPSESLPDEALGGRGLEGPPRNDAELHRTGFQLWLHRVLVLLFVFFCATVGVLLVILPWRPEWTDNYFLLASPGLAGFRFQRFCSRPVQRPGTARYLDRILGGSSLPRRNPALTERQAHHE